MGASREKKMRKTLTQQTTENKSPKRDDASSPAVRILAGIVIALITLGALAFILNATHLSQRLFAAMTVGDIKVMPSEYNVYYISVRNEVYESYQENGADPTSEEYSAYFALEVQSKTEQNIQNTVALAAEARKNGMTLSDEKKEYLSQSLDNLRSNAREQELSLGKYLSQIYGSGVNQAAYEKYLTDALLASQWLTEHAETFVREQADYDAYYAENRDAVDAIDFRFYLITPDALGEDATDEDTAAAQEAAYVKAQEFADKAVSEAAFIEAAIEYAPEESKSSYQDDPDSTLYKFVRITALGDENSSFSWVTEDQRAWLADPELQADDTTVLPYSEGQFYFVFYFVNRQRPDYYPANVRHILFQFKDDEDAATNTPTDAQKEAAKQKAQDALDQWLAGDANEDSFAALANEISEDPGSSSAGGLYESILRGAMTAPFEDWCFDPGRQAGDTGLVETSYGYHVMYFVSLNDTPAWADVVKSNMRNDDVNNYIEGIQSDYPLVKKDYGMSLTIG